MKIIDDIHVNSQRLQFPVYTMAKQSRFFVGIHGHINLGLGKNNSRKWGKNPGF
jgi:hypothetical protein